MGLIDQNRSYCRAFTIAEYALGAGGLLKPSCLLREFQQISSEHITALGFGYERMLKERKVFLLSKIFIQVHRLPTAGDRVELITTPKLPQGVQFIRTHRLLDESGAPLAVADTTWVLCDPESRKILRPKEFSAPYQYTEDSEPCTLPKYRPQRPEKVIEAGQRPVRYSDLDVNQHMNNAIYADIIEDFLPEGALDGQQLAELYIHFQNEAKPAECLTIHQGEGLPQEETRRWYIAATKQNGESCFEGEIALRPRDAAH